MNFLILTSLKRTLYGDLINFPGSAVMIIFFYSLDLKLLHTSVDVIFGELSPHRDNFRHNGNRLV